MPRMPGSFLLHSSASCESAVNSGMQLPNQPDEPDGQGVSVSTLPAPASLPQPATVCQCGRRHPISIKARRVRAACDVAGLPISLTCSLDSAH